MTEQRSAGEKERGGEDGRGAYAGLRVLDISQGFAGPYCAEILAAQGAEVIKVEPPQGDWGRFIGTRHGDNTALSTVANAGKRAICVDATTEEGRGVLARLAADADVLVQNFRAGVAERLGLGEAALRAANPGLVYVSVSGFGTDGEWSRRPATDTVIQGMSGLMALNAGPDGTPRRVTFILIDVVAGIYAAQAVGAALYERDRTGAGRHVEVSLLNAAAALQAIPLLEAAVGVATGAGPGASGEPAVLSVPVGPFATADGHLNITCVNDRQFTAICGVLGYDDWAADPDFATVPLRAARFPEIQQRVAGDLRTRTTAEWLAAFAAADVVSGPIHDYPGVLHDEAIARLGVFRPVDVDGHRVPVPRVPGASAADPVAAPDRGADTAAVLAEHGWSAAEIDDLLRSGAVRANGTEAR